jgi:hypothetical protein
VAALSQLWIFGLYELLRTWRQRASSILRWAKELASVAHQEREARLAAKEARLAAKKEEIVRRSEAWTGMVVFYGLDYERGCR